MSETLQTVSVRLPEDLVDELDEERTEGANDRSRSGYIRDIVEDRHEADRLAGRVDELRAQLQATNAREDEHADLVEYVAQEKRIRDEERARREAPIWTRTKWRVLGEPADLESRSRSGSGSA